MNSRKNVFYGDRVKKMLAEGGLTAAEIARKVGIDRPAFSNYINGRRNPKRITVQRIALALNVPISEISGYHDEKIIPEPVNITESVSGDDFFDSVYQFIANKVAEHVANTNQANTAQKIGLSASQINRIVKGKADISLFPIGALLRICPDIIERKVIESGQIDSVSELKQIIENIKMLADRITDVHTAKTIELMMKGVIK